MASVIILLGKHTALECGEQPTSCWLMLRYIRLHIHLTEGSADREMSLIYYTDARCFEPRMATHAALLFCKFFQMLGGGYNILFDISMTCGVPGSVSGLCGTEIFRFVATAWLSNIFFSLRVRP